MSAITLLKPGDPGVPPPRVWDPSIRLAILTPIYPLTDCRWTLSLPGVLQNVPPGSVHLADWRYGVGESRESLLHTAMSSRPDLTHILFLDGDVIPDNNAIYNLFESMAKNNIDIVAGIYFNSLLTGLAAWKNEQALRVQDFVGRENPVLECDKVGIGLCLFKADVFRKMDRANEERPFFYYKLDARNNQMQSEDFYLFSKLQKYGIKPHIDLRARCSHLKTVALLPEGAVSGGLPQCPPNEHYDPLLNKCVPNSMPMPTEGTQKTATSGMDYIQKGPTLKKD